MSFEAFLADLPLLHTWDDGATWDGGGFDAPFLRRLTDFLRHAIGADGRFLETGAGRSTIALLFLRPRQLISIAPDQPLFERIRAAARVVAAPLEPLQAFAEESQWVLPRLALHDAHLGGALDFVLIDGCHGWPTAFVDLEYGNWMLKPGGFLLLDDVQLHSVKEIARLLISHPAFELALDLGKALVFRKIAAVKHLGEWCDQPYVAQMTAVYQQGPSPYAITPVSTAAKVSHAVKRLPRRLRSIAGGL